MTLEEQINFEYKVSFDDGLRPHAIVYSVDEPAGEVHSLEGYIGAKILIGDEVQPGPSGLEGGLKTQVYRGAGLEITENRIESLREMPSEKNWESDLENSYRERRVNLIKADDKKHLHTILDMHIKSYGEQFEGIKLALGEIFLQFVKASPQFFLLNGHESADNTKAP